MISSGMVKWTLAMVVLVLIVALIAAATVVMASAILQPQVTPSIKVQPEVVAPGDIVVVTGRGWPSLANLVVVIALSPTDDLATRDLLPVGATSVGLDGRIATTFAFPSDVPWTALREAWVVARPSTGNLQAVAHLVVRRLQPTRIPTVCAAATPFACPPQIQGTIVHLAPDLGLLVLHPFDGSANRGVVIRTARVRFLDGRSASLADLKVGLSIAATGWPDSGGTFLAEQITILELGAALMVPVPICTPALCILPTAVPPPTATCVPTPRWAQPTAPPTCPPSDVWHAQYFPNPWFMGPPVVARDDLVVDFNWRYSPPVAGLPAYGYSVRWVGTWRFPRTCRYRFLLLAQGNARLTIDGQTVIELKDSPPAEYPAEVELAGGLHNLQVEYCNMGSAGRIQLRWEYAVQPA